MDCRGTTSMMAARAIYGATLPEASARAALLITRPLTDRAAGQMAGLQSKPSGAMGTLGAGVVTVPEPLSPSFAALVLLGIRR